MAFRTPNSGSGRDFAKTSDAHITLATPKTNSSVVETGTRELWRGSRVTPIVSGASVVKSGLMLGQHDGYRELHATA